MLNDEIKNLVSEYFDEELSPEQENYLFSTLASNNEAREYFKQLNQLKTHTASSAEPFPESLDSKILGAIQKPSASHFRVVKSRNIFGYIAYALVLLAMLGGYVFFGKYAHQEKQLTTARETITRQRDLIQLITLNESEEVTVHGELENKIIIKANM